MTFPLSPRPWYVQSPASLPPHARSPSDSQPSMHVHMRTYTQLAVETRALLLSCRLSFLCVEETIISRVLDRGRDWGWGITSQGGQQRQSTGPPTVFADSEARDRHQLSWPLPASSSGSYSKCRPVMLAMWPVSSNPELCSSQAVAQECKQDRRPLMEASTSYGNKYPKPRFHSQASGYL